MDGAVVLAAGKGTRFEGQKQFLTFHEKMLWEHVYAKACECVEQSNVVVVGVDIPGGSARSESVRIGLEALNPNTERVILLEAARPLVTVEQIRELLEDRHPSVSFVMPLVNTVIMRDGGYLNRNEMWELLTPQAFDYKKLKAAYASERFADMTDETRVMFEYYGIRPHFIETTQNLYKVTYQRDLAVLEGLYQRMEKGEI